MKTQIDASSEMEMEDDLEDELRPEYCRDDLKNGVQGKYLAEFRSGTSVMPLETAAEPD